MTSKPSPARFEYLINNAREFTWYIAKFGDVLRTTWSMDEFIERYEANRRTPSPVCPTQQDEEGRKAFFKHCDKVCRDASTPDEMLAACSAAFAVCRIIADDIQTFKLSEDQQKQLDFGTYLADRRKEENGGVEEVDESLSFPVLPEQYLTFY